MTLASILTRGHLGLQAPLVTVEVHICNGLPQFSLVGLPETAVKESRDRVRSALLHAGFDFPAQRITVNLAPADLPKSGGGLDLPIALGILVASGQLQETELAHTECTGELSLGGGISGVSALLPMVMAATGDGHDVIIPRANLAEAAMVPGARLFPVSHLLEVVAHLTRTSRLSVYKECHALDEISQEMTHDLPDLSEVQGHYQAKRALEIAAAGGHHVMLEGAPGTGKSMLARRIQGILPPLHASEALESAAIGSLAGQVTRREALHQPPFRSPHHSASVGAVIGGGNPLIPGEISLAHGGVLFLDEMPEFGRNVLESLREPLETGWISLARVSSRITFPARFQLLATMNPCPCGYAGDREDRCRCTLLQVQRYTARISGPLLDRFDMFVHVDRQENLLELDRSSAKESSQDMAKRVIQARSRALVRTACPNAWMNTEDIRLHCELDLKGVRLLERAVHLWSLSHRACHRILKLARTIADIADCDRILGDHLAEALSYRKPAP